jgi:hypothetical protein
MRPAFRYHSRSRGLRFVWLLSRRFFLKKSDFATADIACEGREGRNMLQGPDVSAERPEIPGFLWVTRFRMF